MSIIAGSIGRETSFLWITSLTKNYHLSVNPKQLLFLANLDQDSELDENAFNLNFAELSKGSPSKVHSHSIRKLLKPLLLKDPDFSKKWKAAAVILWNKFSYIYFYISHTPIFQKLLFTYLTILKFYLKLPLMIFLFTIMLSATLFLESLKIT